MKTDDDDTRLTGVLHEWQVNAPLPPRFSEAVWTAIATREAARAPRWAWLREQVLGALARPAIAISYALALLLAGWIAGTWRAQTDAARADHALGARYVQSLDPYQMQRHP